MLARIFPILILLDYDAAPSIRTRCFLALKLAVLVKRTPVIVLSGLGQANDAEFLSEGAATFLMRSEKAWDDNSAVLNSGD